MALDIPKPELRYGCPAADQILFNRFYTVGYSYYFRQAKWTLEIVEPGKHINDVDDDVTRQNNFRPDFRLPQRFRGDLSDYRRSGFDRGHLVASANQDQSALQNSETYLLSNMSPQAPQFNRGIWKVLEGEIRTKNESPDIHETYVMAGPVFDFEFQTQFIGQADNNGIKIPIPTHFFKCVLVEWKSGRLEMWAFEFENKAVNAEPSRFVTSTSAIEQRAGINIWPNLLGDDIEVQKSNINPW
ncbi:DNA/RNA non-specific endonuclease [Thalassomonas sp. RHCl1]|uniref:DNA/RNA non-specific endonuclease n=1 Tax=Thalassomonas sp. RHCl1 TaxID=2995320 RepID=UPI00248B7C68|nr:DNA/RNA non-specific endonuclease [Thalassomonas sp. RHCl1]